MKFDILMPTTGKHPHVLDALISLQQLPFPYNLYVTIEGNTWPKAVNIGFSKTKNDVILMDDDTIVFEETFKDFEIIIIDDGSTDNTFNVAKSYTLHNNIKNIIKQF